MKPANRYWKTSWDEVEERDYLLSFKTTEQTTRQRDGVGIHRGKTRTDEGRDALERCLVLCVDETGEVEDEQCAVTRIPVSYTHLTLPTILLV